MGKTCCLNRIGIYTINLIAGFRVSSELLRERPADLCYLKGMGQTIVKDMSISGRGNLRYLGQPSERRSINNTVLIALRRTTMIALRDQLGPVLTPVPRMLNVCAVDHLAPRCRPARLLALLALPTRITLVHAP